MIPIGPIIGALAASRGLGGAGYRQTSPRTGNMALRLMGWFFGLILATALAKDFPWPGGLAIAAVFAASLPALFLRAVLIPLWLPRVAYWFAIVSPPLAHSAEIRGGAALVAMQALARKRTIDHRARRWRWLDIRKPSRWRDQLLARGPTDRPPRMAAIRKAPAAAREEGERHAASSFTRSTASPRIRRASRGASRGRGSWRTPRSGASGRRSRRFRARRAAVTAISGRSRWLRSPAGSPFARRSPSEPWRFSLASGSSHAEPHRDVPAPPAARSPFRGRSRGVAQRPIHDPAGRGRGARGGVARSRDVPPGADGRVAPRRGVRVGRRPRVSRGSLAPRASRAARSRRSARPPSAPSRRS